MEMGGVVVYFLEKLDRIAMIYAVYPPMVLPGPPQRHDTFPDVLFFRFLMAS